LRFSAAFARYGPCAGFPTINSALEEAAIGREPPALLAA